MIDVSYFSSFSSFYIRELHVTWAEQIYTLPHDNHSRFRVLRLERWNPTISFLENFEDLFLSKATGLHSFTIHSFELRLLPLVRCTSIKEMNFVSVRVTEPMMFIFLMLPLCTGPNYSTTCVPLRAVSYLPHKTHISTCEMFFLPGNSFVVL